MDKTSTVLAPHNKLRIWHYFWTLVIFGTVAVGASLWWNIAQIEQSALDAARIQAKAALEKDIIYRRWNAQHGGVYVPITPGTKPNPYLKVPDRDIVTTTGRLLTKINPAYMTRQVHELGNLGTGVKGHITSLNPIRPQNAADPWETQALRKIETGVKEISTVQQIGGIEYLRLIGPLVTVKDCLKCHSEQGYKQGDIRGGISVSVPLAPYREAIQKDRLGLVLSYVTLWLLGISVLASGAFHIKKRVVERNEAEEALRESESRYKVLSEESPLGVSLTDEQGRYDYVNPAFVRMFGYTLQDIQTGGGSLDFAFPGKDFQQVGVKAWKSGFGEDPGEESRSRTINVKCKDGSNKTILFRSVTTDFHGQFVLYEDITERRRAEDALKESELRYRTTFDSIPDSITITRLKDGRYHYVNDGFCRLTGFSSDEVLNKTPMDINLYVNAEDRKRLTQTLREQGELVNFEVQFQKKDGSVFDSLFSAKPLQIGGEDCLVALAKDVTEIKRSEEERAKLLTQLRQAQKMEAIGTLAGGIAHDFNNILGSIMGNSELALRAASQGRAAPRKLEQILDASERAKGLVRQILTFSRKTTPELKPLNINQEISSAIPIIKSTIPKMIQVKLCLDEDLQLINGDPNQIEQVILNLAANAKDAMPNGGMLVIETENTPLDEGYAYGRLDASPGNYVQVTVSDTGEGIEKDALEHIFEPFYTTKEVGKGTGLGLASVYGIVKGHGGYITCHSEPGTGAAFKILLPVLTSEGKPGDAEKAEADLITTGTETILLVDDEQDLREIGQEILSESGYQTITAMDGEEALSIYGDMGTSIDLVILDINMPGMGGLNCLQGLLENDPKATIIIASGYSQEAQIKDIVDSGAAGYIAKPFKMAELLKIVRKVLDG